MSPEELAKILDEVGKRIGPAGEVAWEAAIRYKVTESIFGLASTTLVLLTGTVLLVLNLKKARWGNSPSRYDMAVCVGTFLVIVSSLTLLSGGGQWIPGIFAPEFAVIKDLIGR